jgi:hypothetical protein
MTHDDIAALLVAQVAIALGKPVQFRVRSDAHLDIAVGEHRIALTHAELDGMRAEIDVAAPPFRRSRLPATAVVALLFGGLANEMIVKRAAAIGAVLKPHAERYAARFREMEGGAR